MPLALLLLLAILIIFGPIILVVLTALYYVIVAALAVLGVVAAIWILTSIVKAIDKAMVNSSKKRKAIGVGTSPNSAHSQLPKSRNSVAVTRQPQVLPQTAASQKLILPAPKIPLSHVNPPSYSTQPLKATGQTISSTKVQSVSFLDAMPVKSTLKCARYQIISVLGRGGFGITYLALDIQTSKQVAIKELFLQDVCSRSGGKEFTVAQANSDAFQTSKEKFLAEYKNLSLFRSEAIVEIFECFEENNTAYMVMEFLEGQTLDEVINSSGALSEKQAVSTIKVISYAVDLVHKKGLLHRDIHPRNIIMCVDGSVKLIDFGLSKKLEETVGLGTRRLNDTVSFGMPGYAPLEQYGKRGQLGRYTDIYALGATLYFLITAKEPIAATDRAIKDDLIPLHLVNRSIETATSEAVMSAMQIYPHHRPQMVSEFLRLFESKPQIQVTQKPAVGQKNQSTTRTTHMTTPTKTSVQQDAIQRVNSYFNGLINRYPQQASKLSKSRDWQTSQCAQQTNFWIAKGYSHSEAVSKWEEGARRAADAKVR